MATTRTLNATTPGPISLNASLGAFDLTVIAEDRTHAEVIVSTTDDEGPSADAINAATLGETNNQLTVRFPQGAGGITIQSSGGFQSVNFGGGMVISNVGGGVVVGGNNYGVISTGRGVFVNGRQVQGVAFNTAPVSVVARVPIGSSIDATSVSGDVGVTGTLDRADVDSTSGSVELSEVRDADVRTISGGIHVDRVTGRARLNSTSGSIDVTGPSTARCSARTVSGSIRAAGGIDLDASSVSGRVRNR